MGVALRNEDMTQQTSTRPFSFYMGNVLYPYEAVVSHSKKDRPGFLREQHCFTCRLVLAMELTDKFGSTYDGEWWVVKDAVWIKGELIFLYGKEKWYGNFITCPNCRRQGHLPIDKPYNWELIQQSKEGRNAVQS